MKDFSLPQRKDIQDDEEERDPDVDPEGFDPENLTDHMVVDGDPEIV